MLPRYLLALLLPACDPGVDIGGVAVSPSGDPVRGAELSIECTGPSGLSQGTSGFVAKSDSEGRFHFPARIGCLGETCAIRATHDGESVLVVPSCVDRVRACGPRRCSLAIARVVLK